MRSVPEWHDVRWQVLRNGPGVRERHVLLRRQNLRQHMLSTREFVYLSAVAAWWTSVRLLPPPLPRRPSLRQHMLSPREQVFLRAITERDQVHLPHAPRLTDA
jgi:hypothetical protein